MDGSFDVGDLLGLQRVDDDWEFLEDQLAAEAGGALLLDRQQSLAPTTGHVDDERALGLALDLLLERGEGEHAENRHGLVGDLHGLVPDVARPDILVQHLVVRQPLLADGEGAWGFLEIVQILWRVRPEVLGQRGPALVQVHAEQEEGADGVGPADLRDGIVGVLVRCGLDDEALVSEDAHAAGDGGDVNVGSSGELSCADGTAIAGELV